MNATTAYDQQGVTGPPAQRNVSSARQDNDIVIFMEKYYSLILLIFGTVGNLLCLAVLSRKTFRRSSVGIYLRFLTLSDLMALYTGVLFFTARSLFDLNFRKVDELSCKFHRWLSFTGCDLSSWALVLVSSARLISIAWPMKRLITRLRVYISILVTIILMLAANFPVFIIYGTTIDPRTNKTRECVLTEVEYEDFYNYVFSWLVLVKFGFLPSVLLIALNTALVVCVARSGRATNESQASPGGSTWRTVTDIKMRLSKWKSRGWQGLPSTSEVTTCPTSTDDVTYPPSTENLTTCPAFTDEVTICPQSVENVTNFPQSSENVNCYPQSIENGIGCSPSTEHMTSCPPSSEHVTYPSSAEHVASCQQSTEHVNDCPPSTENVSGSSPSTENVTVNFPSTKDTTSGPPSTLNVTNDPISTPNVDFVKGWRYLGTVPSHVCVSTDWGNEVCLATLTDIFSYLTINGQSQKDTDDWLGRVNGRDKDDRRDNCLSNFEMMEVNKSQILGGASDCQSEGSGSSCIEPAQAHRVHGDQILSSLAVESCQKSGTCHQIPSATLLSHTVEALPAQPNDNLPSACHLAGNTNLNPESPNSNLLSIHSTISSKSPSNLTLANDQIWTLSRSLVSQGITPHTTSLPDSALTFEPGKCQVTCVTCGSMLLKKSDNIPTTGKETAEVESSGMHLTSSGSTDQHKTSTDSQEISKDAEADAPTASSAEVSKDASTESSISNRDTENPKQKMDSNSTNSIQKSNLPNRCKDSNSKHKSCFACLKPDTRQESHLSRQDTCPTQKSCLSRLHPFKRRQSSTGPQTSKSSSSSKSRSLTRTLLVLNSVFLISTTPITVYLTGKTYFWPDNDEYSPSQDVVATFANFAMYTNNAINFILYCITGTRFRAQLVLMFRDLYHELRRLVLRLFA